MKKNDINRSKDKKIAFIITIGTFCFYYVMDYLFKTDVLSAVTFHKHGITISFIGIFLLFTTSLLIGYVTNTIRKSVKKKKKG